MLEKKSNQVQENPPQSSYYNKSGGHSNLFKPGQGYRPPQKPLLTEGKSQYNTEGKPMVVIALGKHGESMPGYAVRLTPNQLDNLPKHTIEETPAGPCHTLEYRN